MKAPTLILKPDVPKKAYRLKCRFTVESGVQVEQLDRIKVKVAEQFVEDLGKQGWIYDPNKLHPAERGFRLSGPFSKVTPLGLPSKSEIRRFSAKDALAGIQTGNKFRSKEFNYVSTVLGLDETDKWEYELSAVFIRPRILTEIPDPHEESEHNRNR